MEQAARRGRAENPTKERILNAAEQVFAAHGFDACSIRTLTTEAGVNLASVHYHFGSKEGLIKAVWERIASPMTEARLKNLDAVEAAAGDKPPPLEAVLEAILRPRLCANLDPERGEITRKLTARMFTDPGMHPIIADVYREYGRRLAAVMKRALPDVSPEELAWKLHFMFGVIDSVGMPERLEAVCRMMNCESHRDTDAILKRMVSFVAAAMRAPCPVSAAKPATA